MSATQAAVDLASKEADALQRKLDKSIEIQKASEEQFTRSGEDADLDVVMRNRLKTERARSLHRDAVAVLEKAREAHRSAVLEAARSQHANDLIALPHFPDSLVLLHDRLIELDRQAFDLLAAYDETVEAGAREWDRAYSTAISVGSHLGSIPKPTLDDAILAAQISATNARERDGRTSVADMFDAEPGHNDWRVSNASAAERAEYLRNQRANEEAAIKRKGAEELVSIVAASANASRSTEAA
jgi:hypothetical protein